MSTGDSSASRAPRRRRRLVLAFAAVAVLSLAAVLVVWAPWVPPPVLRPTGLAAGASTATSVAFRWSEPASGPLPDRYLVLMNGAVAGSVAGTVTSYRQAGLTPANSYQYRVAAERGSTRSPQSAVLTVRTLTPPISGARLEGSWNVYAKNTRARRGSRNGTLSWTMFPTCTAGACDVLLHVRDGKIQFAAKLARAGAVYTGRAVANFARCGPAGNSVPDPETVQLRIRVTAAVGEGQAWTATAFTGTMTGSYRHVSSASFYCLASSLKATLSGTPL